MRVRYVIGTALLLAACDGGPLETVCPPSRCEADLAVASVTVSNAQRDDVTGLPVAARDGIEVRVVVANRGDARSLGQYISLDVRGSSLHVGTVPRVEPGESWSGTFRLDATPLGAFLLGTDTMRVLATVAAIDSDRSNNTGLSDPFHLAVPALTMEVALDTSLLRANVFVGGRVTVTNVSRHAELPASTLAYCLYDLGGRCSPVFNGVAFDSRETPALARGASFQMDYPLTVPSQAVHQNRTTWYRLGGCLAPGSLSATRVPESGACQNVRDVEVRPDYEACLPVRLQKDVEVQAVAICRQPCDIYVFTVDVLPGRSYKVETTDGVHDNTLMWRTRYRDNPYDASSDDGLQPITAETVYLATAPKYCGAPGPHKVVLRVD